LATVVGAAVGTEVGTEAKVGAGVGALVSLSLLGADVGASVQARSSTESIAISPLTPPPLVPTIRQYLLLLELRLASSQLSALCPPSFTHSVFHTAAASLASLLFTAREPISPPSM
jgi:hypothetical protein